MPKVPRSAYFAGRETGGGGKNRLAAFPGEEWIVSEGPSLAQ